MSDLGHCDSCRFWEMTSAPWGRCRRTAPIGVDGEGDAVWALTRGPWWDHRLDDTNPGDWCGEHRGHHD